jgi:hypothetical protein
MSEWHGGKGSKPRPVDKKKFSDNWDAIFGKKKEEKLGIGDFCNRCGQPHNGTGFYIDKIGRVCDNCGIEVREGIAEKLQNDKV